MNIVTIGHMIESQQHLNEIYQIKPAVAILLVMATHQDTTDITEVEAPLQNIGEGERKEMIELAVIRQNKLSIFIVGETGVGKSTLINSLLGDTKASVSHGPESSSHVDQMEIHVGTINGNNIVVYDTKGLIDTNQKSESEDAKLLKSFSETIIDNQVDLVFICHRMFGKLNEPTVHIVKLLAEYFGKRGKDTYIWERCIFVLTQANTYDFDDNEDHCEKMAEVMSSWGIKFSDCLQKYGVPEDIALQIPICATGNKKIALPVTKNWIETLLSICSNRCPLEARQIIMDITRMRVYSKHSAISGAVIGAVIGAIVIPGLGAAPGFTIGLLIGWFAGKMACKKIEADCRKPKKANN